MNGWGAARGNGMIWLILLSVAFVVPFWKLLPDYGISSYWAITAIFPLCTLIMLYIMAFSAERKGGPR
ncbi:hypothetical protein A3731_00835 [Roseovarius sp. HI0049]|nr:hypothetical protein A3731_00835 [Roseovarius sp. HI0049]